MFDRTVVLNSECMCRCVRLRILDDVFRGAAFAIPMGLCTLI